MSFKLCMLLIISCAMTPIRGAFEDFVIENKKDVERFGGPSVDTMSDNDDDCLADEYYDKESFICRSSCDHYGDINVCENGKNVIGLPAYGDYIDKNVLHAVIRQLANHLDIQELRNFLVEGQETEKHREDHYGSSKDCDCIFEDNKL